MWVRNAESNQCALVSVSAVIRARGGLVVVEAWILIAVIGGRARASAGADMTITNARAPSTVFIRYSPLRPPRASTDPPGVGSADLVLCSFATRLDAKTSDFERKA